MLPTGEGSPVNVLLKARLGDLMMRTYPADELLHLLNNNVKGRVALQRFFESLNRQCLSAMNYGRGGTLQTSGELELLKRLGKERSARSNSEFVVFDIGANRGEYSVAALHAIGPGVRAFCFEPVQTTFDLLQRQVANLPEIECLQIALGDCDGEMKIFSDHPGSLVSSALPTTLRDFGIEHAAEETACSRTVDSVCRELKIDWIDLMKLDVEGMEFKVLKGALGLIRQRRIERIQFEFGSCQIHARVFFRDFYELLSPFYRIFRIVRDGLVEINDYETRHEVFWTTNYLAELRRS
jgi:FkbM family methyltransferase